MICEASLVDGLSDQGIKVLFLHAVVAEFCVEAEAGEELCQERNRALVGFSIGAFHHFEAAGDADATVESWLAFGAELHTGNQAKGVGKTVVHAANR